MYYRVSHRIFEIFTDEWIQGHYVNILNRLPLLYLVVKLHSLGSTHRIMHLQC